MKRRHVVNAHYVIVFVHFVYPSINPVLRYNHIGGVMVSVLSSSAVDRGFEHQAGLNIYL
jgi:hypothetical protein